MKYTLKKQYQIDQDIKEYIAELERIFFDNNHELLRGKRINQSLKNTICNLYYELLGDIHISWTGSLLDIELEDLKHDGFCKGNTNKEYWLMAYMLSWLADLPDTLTEEYLFRQLTVRQAHRELVNIAYE